MLIAVSSRLDDMDAQLLALPTDVVEPPVVGLLVDASPLLLDIAGLGRVIAPLPITSTDLTVEGVPRRAQLKNPLLGTPRFKQKNERSITELEAPPRHTHGGICEKCAPLPRSFWDPPLLEGSWRILY